MADLFIVRERIKFTLKLLALAAVGSLLAALYFRSQLEFETDRTNYLMASVLAGTLSVGWVGLFTFYRAINRIKNPARSFTDPIDEFPWWIVRLSLLVVFIVTLGIGIYIFQGRTTGAFDLMRRGKLAALKEMLSKEPGWLERGETKGGATLVRVAYQEERYDALAVLAEAGADLTELAAGGSNPLLESIDDPQMLSALLNAGFNPEILDTSGLTPLHLAVDLQSADAANALLSGGAQVDVRDAVSRTPLMRAVESDQLEMAKLLIENGADLNAYDRRGDTSLHRTVRRRNIETTTLLLDQGADPKIFNFIHLSPLHIAAINDQRELVELLLQTEGLANLHDDDDRTPLDHTLAVRKYDMAELLIGNGADINRISKSGSTQLHDAILKRDYMTARFMIRQGADANIPDAKGETAFDIMNRKQLSGLIDLIEGRTGEATNVVESAESAEPIP
jgi:ankyrin repeat protein